MRTVNIGTLKNQLSAHLKLVRNGEEIIVCDRNVPVARILPFNPADFSEEEARLVASGAMKLPEREMDWDLFWSSPAGKVRRQAAVNAAIESRGDR